MGRILDTLKNNEPSLYWHAVDMAAREETLEHIVNVLRVRVETANEYRATVGQSPIAVRFA